MSPDSTPRAARSASLAGLLLAAAAGWGSRRAELAPILPDWVVENAGDACWTVAAYCGFRLIRPSARPRALGIAAFGVSAAVELSQLIRAPWLDAIRGTTLGALALGQGFLWSDFPRYAAGAILAATIDHLVRVRGAGAGTPAANRGIENDPGHENDPDRGFGFKPSDEARRTPEPDS